MSVTIHKGNKIQISLEVQTEDGDAYPLTDCDLKFSVKKAESETTARIEKTSAEGGGIEITDELQGEATITIDEEDTQDLISGAFVCDVELTDASDKPQTIYKDFFLVLDVVSN